MYAERLAGHRQVIAAQMAQLGMVGYTPDAPVTFKSGIRSPVYVDNRRLIAHPALWHRVIEALMALIEAEAVPYDVIAGIETAGIPHSAALAYALHRPSVFVRKQPKEHGLRARIEGGDVAGARVLLLEDLVTTGGSSLSGVAALREAGAQVADCLCIVTYGFAAAHQAFETAGVRLHPLLTFEQFLEAGIFDAAAQADIRRWLRDPLSWAANGNPG
jgi:orotate phosphoribosyltransferase